MKKGQQLKSAARFLLFGLYIDLFGIKETCNCDRNIYVNWYEKAPFVYTTTNNKISNSSLFPPIIEDIFKSVCGSCKDYKHPVFYYYKSYTGENPHKSSEFELKRDISKDVDISVPIYGREGRNFIDNSVLITVAKSSGCSLIVRRGRDKRMELNTMVKSVLLVWPILVITCLIGAIAGALVWLIVSV